DHARIDTIDQETGPGLHHRRDDVERGESKAEVGVADAVVLAYEQEQRREQHDVVVADEMAEADAAHELLLARASPRQRQVEGLVHVLVVCVCVVFLVSGEIGGGDQLPGLAAGIACQPRCGVAGMSMWGMPSSDSASTTAFMIEVSAPAQPASPQPFTPSGLVLARTRWFSTENIRASDPPGLPVSL